MKTILLLRAAATLAITSAAPLKGAQRHGNLRQRVLHKSKTDEPTVSPSTSPTLSPTECEKGCDKTYDSKLNKLNSAASDDAIIIEFDDAVTPSPQATPSPTFIDDFVDTPAPVPVSEETGEPESNGIGISVDVGGNENIVGKWPSICVRTTFYIVTYLLCLSDVTVIINQNGGASTDGDDITADDLYDDIADDDYYGSSMSMSMGMDDTTDDYGEDYGAATNDEAPEEMEKPEDVADVTEDESKEDKGDDASVSEFDDDFSTFFTKKKDTPTKQTEKVWEVVFDEEIHKNEVRVQCKAFFKSVVSFSMVQSRWKDVFNNQNHK